MSESRAGGRELNLCMAWHRQDLMGMVETPKQATCRTWKELSMRTMSEDSLETRRRWCRSTTSGAVQRPRNPGWHSS